MSKTTVTVALADIKSLIDYEIVDDNLDQLILRTINMANSRIAQWFIDYGLFDEVGTRDTFTTTANQEYIDIATETIDLDQPIILTERTNDNYVDMISYREYKMMFPDPTANTSSTPDFFALFGNRLYLGPTPSESITLYLDYVKLITKLELTDSLPFEHKYDELVYAISIEYMRKWLDSTDRSSIMTAREDVDRIKHELIVGASKNIGMNQQVQSRRSEVPYFSPRKVV